MSSTAILDRLRDVFYFPVDFPDEEIIQDASINKTSICIVAVIGKGKLNPFSSKATPLNPLIDREIFDGTESFVKAKINEGAVECFYDAESRVMYLHVVSHYDINLLSQLCQQQGNLDEGSMQTLLQEEEVRHAQNLLLIFSLSHIVMVCHPGGTFDMSYLRLFHSLDSFRLKLQSGISEVLSTVPGVGSDWAEFGRLCSPRVLFLFETSSVDVHPEEIEAGLAKASKKYPPLRKLQMSMEDIIYRILRKARAITNITNNSLFSVPGNMDFVYIHCRRAEVSDPSEFMINQLRQQCFPSTDDNAPVGQRPRPYSVSRRKLTGGLPSLLPLSAPSSLTSQAMGSAQKINQAKTGSSRWGQEQGLKEFLWQHISLAFSKSVNDNVGRHGIQPVFVLPTLGAWLSAAAHLHSFLFEAPPSSPVTSAVSSLNNSLDISLRFSEARCKKVVPLAETAYQQDLPAFYITAYHLNKVAKAKRVLSQYARGPALPGYLRDLERSCEDVWQAGRQQCEVLSLTGNLCNSKVHSVEERHVSHVKTKAACNCGRLMSEKEDPFDHKYANYSFYQTLEETCCGPLEHFPLPVFMSTTPDARAATVPPTTSGPPSQGEVTVGGHPEEELQQSPQKQANFDQGDKEEVFSTLSELSLALSLGQTGAGDLDQKVSLLDGHEAVVEAVHLKDGGSTGKDELSIQDTESHTQAKDQTDITQGSGSDSTHSDTKDSTLTGEVDRDTTLKQEKDTTPLENRDLKESIKETSENLAKPPCQRQASSTEYLAHMLTTASPPGLLPRFPSFCLARLGSASHYSHMIGLEFPGFLPGGNFLLPWDIAVKAEEKWPSLGETHGKKRMQRKTFKGANEGGDTMSSVRVYLGMEYECPRGHRFFCSGPDKVIKVSSNSIVKDNAGRLVHLDMPLYTLCQCKFDCHKPPRQPKGCMAQLMRIYVVTPRDIPSLPTVQVLLQPRVQAHPPPAPQFHPGLDEAIELPADGLWVLRLPHMYQDEKRVYLIPSEHQQVQECYLARGVFGYKIL